MKTMKTSQFKSKLYIKLTIAMMLTTMLGVGLLTYVSYKQSKEIFTQNSIDLLNENVKKYEDGVKDSINSLKYDITMLSFNQSVLGFLRAYENKYKYDEVSNKTYEQYFGDVRNIFELMMKQNKSYFQIRILDINSGKELVKLIKKDSKIINIEKSELQSKRTSNYFRNVKSSPDDIYISKINLNREFGNVEFPIKPTIRIAKIIKSKGKDIGLLIINADISKLFKFQQLRDKKEVDTYITNEKGEYILNTSHPEKEFGFEFGKVYVIGDDFLKLKVLYKNDNQTNNILEYDDNFIMESRKIKLLNDKFIVVTRYIPNSVLDRKKNEYFFNLLGYIVLIVLVISVITLLIVKQFTKPITYLSEVAREIAQTKGNKDIRIKLNSKDEVGELATTFNVMLRALIDSRKEVEEFASKLEDEVEQKTKELKHLNENLQKSVDEQILEIRKKDQVLMQQAKMASMGEMIGAIAHQWRQPLNVLGLNIQLLLDMSEDKKCDIQEVEIFVEKNMKTIQFMSNTIDDFRNFFREDKEKQLFNIKDAINSTISLQKDQLKNHNIDILLNLEDVEIVGFRNEFMQVILNLISNSRDAIDDKNINGIIEITDKIVENSVEIDIKDNGGGIPADTIERVFEPYFTTKEQGKGTGMGLYMSKEILEHMDATIECNNIENGVEFKIVIPINEMGGGR